ncbi:unnamed protein product [Paramecium sonneborni]|uniref:Uncharacterized protein n=1 Tax=Paramecium sonneborni TaxID=65129 RepID=A0A8S1RRD3_9CILI|nr:unnamed protein product [Paramecium sonneborni]
MVEQLVEMDGFVVLANKTFIKENKYQLERVGSQGSIFIKTVFKEMEIQEIKNESTYFNQ